ncbi:MAG: tetratricopeptide repeat protein [Acidobacteriota bacterium]|nr:tetratricopeptide repeat protein [Acidobacteriota bacterium]
MFRRFFMALPFLLLCLVGVRAQQNERDMKYEQTIWDQLQAVAPSAVEDFKAATVAMDAGNYAEAVRLYEDVHKKAPDLDTVLRRLGTSLALQGNLPSGLEFLEQAVAKRRSPENLYSLAHFLAFPAAGKSGTRDQKWRAYSLMLEADPLPKTGDDGEYEVLLGGLAMEFDQTDVFRRVTERLVAKHPELMQTHYFNALLAALDERWVTAEREIKKAESMGLPHDVTQEFLDSGVHTQARIWRYSGYGLVLVAVWIVGLGLLFLLGKLMSRKTLRSIEDADPNAVASGSDLSLRKWYRRLINVGGVYYYLSIPFVIFLVVGFAAAVTYAAFAAGHVPIKLVLIICVGAVVTVYKMIRSLFIKIDRKDPGRSLAYEEAPGLWDLARRVAETVGTRSVDEIRVTPGTDLAVYEGGSRRERSKDDAPRILILGVGVLNDFQVSGFRAVLAHEYGHFSHRDTAGGDVALRVNANMLKFAHAMVLSRQNVWWNIAFQFLRIYHFIFRRISHGATRLQEVLADRVAAAKFGSRAFEEGLTHVIRKSAEFKFVASREINESANARRALQNLYELAVTANADVEEEAEQTLNRKTTEDDTHPSPSDRFRFTRKIVSQSEPPISGIVWDLFTDRTALTLEMTSTIQSVVSGSA